MIEEDNLRRQMHKVSELVRHLDTPGDTCTKAQARELLEAVMDLHGEAIDRILVALKNGGEAGERILDSLAGDPVVSNVLLLYGLHPFDLETRVRSAVERLQSKLRSYGVGLELAGMVSGGVRIRVRGADSAFTARTVKAAIEDELYESAPDATSLVVRGLENFAAPNFVPVEKIGMLAGKAGD